ncbi:hypothetical protein GE061_010018 [Apolygus lucorum]|uniref:Peptidase S1 domain-containing protein n=1 Tax=Apolygus lucorum TaxID=248454 RepID=A0A8S9Y4J8_APOLU|nr:hypothetical protein GE061_010018 [Apolygus lucorum]
MNPTQLCTQAHNKSTCHGDSGGPVIWLDPETNRYTVVGVVSFGPDCGDHRSSINADVSAHLSWIHRWIDASLLCIKRVPRF